MDLNTTWFLLIGVLLGGYAVLDGFDLGVGVLHLFARSDRERSANLRAVGPFWDGNEVWLLAGGGAMFAAFPVLYATVFSGFYLAFMLLLVALILRATALEFHHQVDSPRWRRFWDWCFGIGSLVPALLLGVALGNVIRGLPVTAAAQLRTGLWPLLNPFALLTGLLGLALFVMHGAAWLRLKTEGEPQARMGRWLTGAWMGVIVLFLTVVASSFFAAPRLFNGLLSRPVFWLLLILMLGALIALPLLARAGRHLAAFLASAVIVVAPFGLAATGLFPRLVLSSIDAANDLTIYNVASTPRTLTAMLVIALIGMPLVIVYHVYVYRTFAGKVGPGDGHY